LRDPDLDGVIHIKIDLRKWDVGVWTGSSWPKIGTYGGQL